MLPEPVNSDAQDFCPTPLGAVACCSSPPGAGRTRTARPSCGIGRHLHHAPQPAPPATWAEPRNLGCAPDGPNGPGMEYGPSLTTQVGTLPLLLQRRTDRCGDPGHLRLQVVGRPEVPGLRRPVAELNVAGYDDFMPNVSRDGREIVFASSRPGGLGASDIYTSTPQRVRAAWRAGQPRSHREHRGRGVPAVAVHGRDPALLRPQRRHLRQPETGLVDSRTTDAGVPLGHPGVRSCVHGRVQSPGSTRQNGWSTGSR